MLTYIARFAMMCVVTASIYPSQGTAKARVAPVIYRLMSCRVPANDLCRTEATFEQPRASGKCEAARTAYLAANRGRSAVCLRAL